VAGRDDDEAADEERKDGSRERFERQAASPMRVSELFEMFLDTDVRDALPLIQAPTLVLHRRGDRAVNYRAGRWLAEQIEGSRYTEFEGEDHFPWVGDGEAVLAAIEHATGRTADVIVGKPEPPMYEAARDRLGPGRMLAVGDLLDVDIAGARRAGWCWRPSRSRSR